MKIAVVVAMDKELNLILNLMDKYEVETTDNTTLYKGKIGANDIVASKCGIGKVNSALNTYKLIKAEQPDLLINSGVAGGGGNGLKVGDVLVADKVAYHDVWCGPGASYGAADGLDVYMLPSPKVIELARSLAIEDMHFGLICSGDKFISKPEEISTVKASFPDVLAVDMESASIAQTCILNNVDYAIVRVISDTPGESENISQYKNFWSLAPEKTFKVVEKIIENI